jgi:glycosyltransferase involved in cell wall biosynthesis
MKLGIAIPALNEEDNIESIIQRSLAARQYIQDHSSVTDVEVTVVSDGSTDRTVELASRYKDLIRLIVFSENQGYGAAIKEAWMESDAELLGFLDADGTCDPKFFAPLCNQLLEKKTDVVLGCRLNTESEMPFIRRMGNAIFALLLSIFSNSRVRDTASGMRVVRRSSLTHLFPLPNGLHFTPAMSARAMMSDAVQISELDMPYHERVGESKLHVIRDGFRFLRVIIETGFLYRPSRPLNLAGIVLTLISSMLMFPPLVYYLQHRAVLEWMIYRFLVSHLLGTAACLAFSASYILSQMTEIALAEEIGKHQPSLVQRFFRSGWFWVVNALLTAVGGSLVLGSLWQLLETGSTYEHWSRFIAMTFCLSIVTILLTTRCTDYVLGLVRERVLYRQNSEKA